MINRRWPPVLLIGRGNQCGPRSSSSPGSKSQRSAFGFPNLLRFVEQRHGCFKSSMFGIFCIGMILAYLFMKFYIYLNLSSLPVAGRTGRKMSEDVWSDPLGGLPQSGQEPRWSADGGRVRGRDLCASTTRRPGSRSRWLSWGMIGM